MQATPEARGFAVMKLNTEITSLVAHITIRGLESLERGQIDLSDPRLDGGLGTLQLELHTDEATATQMDYEIKSTRAFFGAEAALHYLDSMYIKPWRVRVALMTSGDSELDQYVQNQAKMSGHELNVATA